MKIIHLETRYKKIIKLSQKQIDTLPKELALFSSIQFLDSLKHIKKQLEENKIKVSLSKGIHSKYKGQLLGCEVKKLKDKAFLYIGDGLFHPYALMLKNNKPTYSFNPFNKKLIKIKEKDIEKIKKRQKGALLKFLTAKEIGILVSTKPGQNRLKEAMKLEKKLKDKNCYILLTDTIDFNELENFPFIECFVNTACPRIAYDDSKKISKPIINIGDITTYK